MCKHTFYIHSSFAGRLGHFHVLTIVNNATVNMCGCRYFFEIPISIILDIYPGIDHIFNFLRNLHSVFSISHSPTRCCYTISHLCCVRSSWREDVTVSSLGRFSILKIVLSLEETDEWREN